MLHLQACFAIPLFHPALTFASSRPSQRLSRISVRGFLSSPLIVLGKRLKLTRNVLVRHCLGRPEYGPCRVQIFFAQHFASTIPVRTAQRRRTTTNHGETDRTIAQTFISALHLYETRILRFTITCAPREWWERGSSPGGYLATSVDQLVTLLFGKYAREVAKALPSDQAYPLRGSEKRKARAYNGFALGVMWGFGTFRS